MFRLAAGAFLALSGACAAFAGAPIEFAVKATFIYKFASYVEWPVSAFPTQSSPLSICTIGSDAVSTQLDQVTAGQKLNAHPILIKHVQAPARDGSCQIVYIADANGQAVSEDLGALRGAPVLTITDIDRTKNAPGIIAFTVLENHVRFDIDEAAAAQNGLKISSKLLDLAHNTPRGAP